MRLREILTELNSRSKKTAPDIFDESINCGFEAEVIFSNTGIEQKEISKFVFKNWIEPYSSIKKVIKSFDRDRSTLDNKSWFFVKDSSINPRPKSRIYDRQDPEQYGVEIVSPVFPNITIMLEEMKSLFSWLENYAYVNETTGLHVSMSMGEPQQNEINDLKLIVLAADDNILKDFNRENEDYAESITQQLINTISYNVNDIERSDIKDFKSVERSISEKLKIGKYSSIFFKNKSGRSNNQIVEFRSMGNMDYLSLDHFRNIENAIKHYAICLKAAYSDTYFERDYRELVYRLIRKHYDKYDEAKENKKYLNHPFVSLLKRFKVYNDIQAMTETMLHIFRLINSPHEFKIEIGKERFMWMFGSLCLAIGYDNKEDKIDDTIRDIVKKTLKDFGIDDKQITTKSLYYARFNKNRNINKLTYNGIEKGLSVLLGRKIIKSRKNYPLNIFVDGGIVIYTPTFSSLKTRHVDDIDKNIFNFLNKYRNNDGTILIFTKEYLEIFEFMHNGGEGGNIERMRDYEDMFMEHFQKIYNISFFDLSYKIDRGNYRIVKGEYLQNFLDEMSDVISVKYIDTPSELSAMVHKFAELNSIKENSLYNHLFSLERLCD